MTELRRLNEAIEWVREVRMSATPEHLGPHTKEQMWVVEVAARAYADLVNGERVEPDYEAAFRVMSGDVAGQLTEDEIREGRELVAEAVRAAIGDRLLIDPPKEEE